MHLQTSVEGNFHIIAIEGDLDALSSIDLDKTIEAALKARPPYVLIDCTKLNYIASAGLGVFISYLSEFETKQIKLALFGMSEKVSNVFEILGLEQLMQIYNTKEEAQSAVQNV